MVLGESTRLDSESIQFLNVFERIVAGEMFCRKLKALDYHSAENINIHDPQDLKLLVIWLEDQKIRHYKIEDRAGLHNHAEEKWKQTFKQYLSALECPFNPDTQLQSVVDWLLGVAVRYEYGDAAKEHSDLRCGIVPSALGTAVQQTLSGRSNSALDIDPSDKTFCAGVQALAKIVQVTRHPDPSVLLEAVRIVVAEKLSALAMEAANSSKTVKSGGKHVKQFSMTPKEFGFDLGDPVLGEAAKVLRLLHIQELRHLQTHINEVIVAVQAMTANPKTDQSLGKVGK